MFPLDSLYNQDSSDPMLNLDRCQMGRELKRKILSFFKKKTDYFNAIEKNGLAIIFPKAFANKAELVK